MKQIATTCFGLSASGWLTFMVGFASQQLRYKEQVAMLENIAVNILISLQPESHHPCSSILVCALVFGSVGGTYNVRVGGTVHDAWEVLQVRQNFPKCCILIAYLRLLS